ncbi:MAG: GTP pyrophosphokinase [Spirochaetota bacterium]
MNDQSPLEVALEIALRAHRGQKDRAGRAYITHPLRMMARARTADEQVVAVLHDTVEDGGPNGVTMQTLRDAGFAEGILVAVDGLTRRKKELFPDRDEDEPYEEFVERAARDPLARAVKLLDLQDNMDVSRLPEVGEADIPRINRYLRAWHRLTGA